VRYLGRVEHHSSFVAHEKSHRLGLEDADHMLGIATIQAVPGKRSSGDGIE
jgi:hypothetical protein